MERWNKMRAMEDKIKKLQTHVRVGCFSDEERQVIKRARRILGSDLPSFYHAAIMDMARRVAEGNGK